MVAAAEPVLRTTFVNQFEPETDSMPTPAKFVTPLTVLPLTWTVAVHGLSSAVTFSSQNTHTDPASLLNQRIYKR